MKMVYWNIHKMCDEEPILTLLKDTKPSILFISEYENIKTTSLNQKLALINYSIIQAGGICNKVLAIKQMKTDFDFKTEGKRFIQISSKKQNIKIIGLHLEARMNEQDIVLKHTKTLEDMLKATNDSNKKTGTIYIGDFNCMPFGNELINVDTMNCVLFKKIALKKKDKNILYNPMMLLLNEKEKNYGSFIYESGNINFHWYTHDQVIITPNLINKIKQIKFIKKTKNSKYYCNKTNKILISDHLPLLFELKGEK